jgi:steroid 5-alpha reductase family enzyme
VPRRRPSNSYPVDRRLSTAQRVVIVIVLAAIALIVASHIVSSYFVDVPWTEHGGQSTDTYFVVAKPSLVNSLVMPIALAVVWGSAGIWLFRPRRDDHDATS